jgi:hypothetical protein
MNDGFACCCMLMSVLRISVIRLLGLHCTWGLPDAEPLMYFPVEELSGCWWCYGTTTGAMHQELPDMNALQVVCVM